MIGLSGKGVGVARKRLRPAIDLVFAGATALDPRITFTRASTGTYVNSSGVLTSAAIDAPRFDYDPVTLAAKGLLIEEQRTNSCLYSSDLSQANWAKGATVSLSYDTTAAPDGTTTADTITLVTGADTGVYQSIACSSSTAYTFSLYVKLGTMAASDYKIAIYNNTNAAFIAADIVPTQTPSSTAWTRITYTFTTPATCVSVRVYCFRNSLSAASSVNVWGMQLELGAFATSYIPTTTTALTRAADVATVTGADFSSWYNEIEGTMVAEALTFNSSVSKYPVSAHDGSQAELIAMYFLNANGGGFVVDGSVTQVQIESAGLATQSKIAFAFKANDFAMCINGSSPATDASGTMPTVNRLQLGNRADGARTLNGHIRSFKYYPTRLSNAELQAITA